MSFATKLCHVVYADGSATDVMKHPVTDKGKISLPGGWNSLTGWRLAGTTSQLEKPTGVGAFIKANRKAAALAVLCGLHSNSDGMFAVLTVISSWKHVLLSGSVVLRLA